MLPVLVRQLVQLPVIVLVDQVYSSIPILQFFYPNIEMNLCLHGALAAVFLLMNQRQTNHITVSNTLGTLFQAIKLDNQAVQIKVSAETSPAYISEKFMWEEKSLNAMTLEPIGMILTNKSNLDYNV